MATARPDVDSLVPHRGTARFLEAVEELAADRAVCRARIPANSPFVAGKRVPAFVGLELGAQAAAAVEALSRFENEDVASPRIGYLVGARDAVFHGLDLPVERPLYVSVRLADRSGPLNVYEIAVILDGETRVEATISTTIP